MYPGIFFLLSLFFSASLSAQSSDNCSGYGGHFTLAVEHSGKTATLTVLPSKLHSSLGKVSVQLVSGDGSYKQLGNNMAFENGKPWKVKLFGEEVEKFYNHLVITPENDLENQSPFAVACEIPKAKKLVTLSNPEEVGVYFGTLFSDEKTTSHCTGSVVSKVKEKNSGLCRYQLLTAGHCLVSVDEKGNKFNVMKLTLPPLGLITEVKVVMHPKYVPSAGNKIVGSVVNEELPTLHDIGIVEFTEKCVSDEEFPVFSIAKHPIETGEACAIISKDGPFLASAQADVTGMGIEDFDIHYSKEAVGNLNEGRETPRGGWSGASVTRVRGKQREIVGCYTAHRLEGDKELPVGICSGTLCLDWARSKVK